MSEASPGQPADAVSVYRRLLGYTFRHWLVFAAGLAGMVVYAGIQTGFAALIEPLLDKGFVNRDPDFIRLLPAAILLIFVLRGLASFSSSFCMTWVGRQVIKSLRAEIFRKFLCLPTRYYDANSGGVLLSKLTFNTEQVATCTTQVVTTLVRDLLTIIGLVGWMFWLNVQLTLFIFVVGPLIALLVRQVSRYFRRYSARIQSSMGDVTRVAEEVLEAHRVVKVFNGQTQEQGAFDTVNEANRRMHMKLTGTKAASAPIIQLLAAFGLAGVIYVATLDPDTVTVGRFSSFLSAMLLIMDPLKRVTNINAPLQQGIAAAQSIFGLLDEKEEKDTGTRTIGRARGDVEFRGVSFLYTEDKGHVLRNLDLVIPAGQRLAIVGRSGSGKSTLVSLLPRFYDPTRGEILLDGVDIREYQLADLRRQISLVSQDIKLFNDTIANNIAYGAMAGADVGRVLEAAEAAHVLEFTDTFPAGMDTIVGDRGVLLSGGQRQRIAIARAILADAPVLILDEATSALDTESERHIQGALETLMAERTTLVIAHRLSTIERADRIIVMAGGEIVESGTHRELLAERGQYATLHRLQLQQA